MLTEVTMAARAKKNMGPSRNLHADLRLHILQHVTVRAPQLNWQFTESNIKKNHSISTITNSGNSEKPRQQSMMRVLLATRILRCKKGSWGRRIADGVAQSIVE
eukprot:2012132-Amphidinium_carterae.1